MEECLVQMAGVLFSDDKEAAAAFFLSQPAVLMMSDRLEPLARLMTEELKATWSQARTQ